MNKEFTKKDLKNGDVVVMDNGDVGIICIETGTMIFQYDYDVLEYLDDNLCTDFKESIIDVYRPLQPYQCGFDKSEYEEGEHVFHRDARKKMTIEEICDELGYEVEIVNE